MSFTTRKPRAKPAAIPGVIPHSTRVAIIEALLKPEHLKPAPGQPNVWGREIKLLNAFLRTYPDPQFWLDLHPGYKLNSLAFFRMERGKEELEQAWRLHVFAKAQQPTSSPHTLTLEPDSSTPPAALPRRTTPIEWVDGRQD